MNGTMLWFNAAKGHGFIRTEDGERLLIEADGLAQGRSTTPVPGSEPRRRSPRC